MRNKEILFWSVIILICVLALVSRFALLEERVLHHDEGVNYFFAEKIVSGKGFFYEPLNYHGPFYFFFLSLSFLIFGINEFGLRFPAAVFGVLSVLAPLFFKIGRWRERVVGAIFLLLSPSLMYYSRYSIHESAFVFFSLMSVYFLSLILEKKSLKYLPFLAGSLGALLITKETAIIMLFVLFVIGVVNYKKIREIKFRSNGKIVLMSAFIFILIYVVFFTSFFSNIAGIEDSFKGFMPWIERGVGEAGHDKPFYYYFLLLGEYEWPLLMFALVGIFYALKNRKIERVLNLNLALWAVLIFLIYSLIPYKTPWLVINLSVPLCLIAGIGAFQLRLGKLKWAFLFVGILYLGYMTIYLNFINFSGIENKYAYVHTDKDVLRLAEKIDNAYEYNRKGILIVSDEYWPLPFYLHGKSVNYLKEEGFMPDESLRERYDIFIVRDKIFKARDWGGYKYQEGFKLRDNVGLVFVGYTNGLKST